MNKTETALFERGDWWDKRGAFRLLHDINPTRLRWLEEVGGGLAGKRLFDLGCGGGIFAEAAAAMGARVVGVDASAAAVEVARRHAAEQQVQIEYRCQDGIGGGGQGEAGQYDVVACLEMLEHVENPSAVVADVATLLAPGGLAVFSTINRTFAAWLRVIAAAETALNLLPVGTHDYRRFVRPAELAAMCRDCGLSVVNVTGLRYSFFGRVYLLDERNVSANYFLAARRPPADL